VKKNHFKNKHGYGYEQCGQCRTFLRKPRRKIFSIAASEPHSRSAPRSDWDSMSLISPGLEGVAIGTALKSWFDMFGF